MNRIIIVLLIFSSGCMPHHAITYKREQFQPSCQVPNWADPTKAYAMWAGREWIILSKETGKLVGAIICPEKPNDSFLFILYSGMEGGDYWFIVDSEGNISGLL